MPFSYNFNEYYLSIDFYIIQEFYVRLKLIGYI